MARVEQVDESRTRRLRRAVLRPQLAPDAPLPGDDLPDGVHIGAVDPDGEVACTCFVYPVGCPWLPDRAAWRLRSMATWPQRRGEGLGAAVLAAAIDHVTAAGAQVLWCHARTPAVPFYERAGFVGHGDVYAEGDPAIPHLNMALELPAAPTSSPITGRSAGAR